MSVDPAITRLHIEEELEAMAPLASSYGWQVSSDLENLSVIVQMKSAVDGEVYVVEARCDDYTMLPPYFDFIHPETGERGSKSCYPSDGNDFFHKKPCICVQWNRKAYSEEGGPHGNWTMTNWREERPAMTSLGDMFHLIQTQINKPDKYTGRME